MTDFRKWCNDNLWLIVLIVVFVLHLLNDYSFQDWAKTNMQDLHQRVIRLEFSRR